MIWKKYTIYTKEEAADIVASVLFDNNIVGVEIEDNKNLDEYEMSKMFVDIPKLKQENENAKVIFYISTDKNDNINKFSDDRNLVDISYMPSTDNIFSEEEFTALFNKIMDEINEYKDFMDLGSLEIEIEKLDDKVFLNKWKENFKPIIIDDVSIIPYFQKETCEKNKFNIYIEPGNAFGTGQHETTRLCVKEIFKLLNTNKYECNKFLDIGCGSGILGILAKILGAKEVFCVDIDENVYLNLSDNLKLNNIADYDSIDNYNENSNNSIYYGFGNIFTDEGFKSKVFKNNYDIIVANILAPVIISLLEQAYIHKYINKGGYFICSGIIKDMEQNVKDAINKVGCFEIINIGSENNWVSFLLKKI